MKKSVLKIMLGTIILEAILVCLFILIGNFDDVAWRALESVGIIFGYSIPCLFYSKIYDNEKYKNIALCGAGIVCISALIGILNLWDLIDEGEFLTRIVVTFNVIIWSLAFMSWILSYMSINNLLNLFKKISLSLIMLLSFFITLIIWTDFPEGFLSRLYYVLIVLTVGSFICTLILTRIYKKEIVEVSQAKNNTQSDSNNFVSQNNVTQHEAQPIINPTQITNSMDNVQENLNSEQITDNNESSNNVQ